MLDLAISHVFGGLHAAGSGLGVVAHERTGLVIATVMARRGQFSALSGAVRQRYGFELADAATVSGNAHTAFVGTGSGRWLAVFDDPAPGLVPVLQHDLNGLASVVDQSHGFGVLRLSGPAVLLTFEKGVALDLSPEVFKAGAAATTTLAHVSVHLWKVDEAPTFDVAVPRSYAGAFSHWLETTAAIHGLAVGEK